MNIPIIIYNVPSRTGCSVTLEQLEKLKKHPNIAGIKEASGNMGFFTRVCSLADENFGVYCGCDEINVPAIAAGAIGIISVLANILPRECHEMVEFMERGEVARARSLQHRYGELISALFLEVNPIPVKTAMNMHSFREVGNVGSFRLPMCEMTDKSRAKLEYEIEKLKEDFERYR